MNCYNVGHFCFMVSDEEGPFLPLGVITGAMQALNNFQIPSPPLTCSPFQQPSFPNTKQQTSSPSPALSSANDSSRNRNLNLESHYGTESPKSAPSPRHFQTPPSTSAQMADYERFAKMADFSGMPAAPARNQPPTAITPRYPYFLYFRLEKDVV